MEDIHKFCKKNNIIYDKSNYEEIKEDLIIFIKTGKINYKNKNAHYYNFLGLYEKIINKNLKKSCKLLLIAFKYDEQNNTSSGSAYNLGNYYNKKFNNTETEPDLLKQYYKAAINKYNSAYAYAELGLYYETYEKNNDKAKKYYIEGLLKAHEYHLTPYYLADFYEYKENNYKLGLYYYKYAAHLGNIPSIKKCITHYTEIEVNYEEAEKYYKLGVKAGCKDTMYNYGLFYRTIRRNIGKMFELFYEAANLGHDSARNELFMHSIAVINNTQCRL